MSWLLSSATKRASAPSFPNNLASNSSYTANTNKRIRGLAIVLSVSLLGSISYGQSYYVSNSAQMTNPFSASYATALMAGADSSGNLYLFTQKSGIPYAVKETLSNGVYQVSNYINICGSCTTLAAVAGIDGTIYFSIESEDGNYFSNTKTYYQDFGPPGSQLPFGSIAISQDGLSYGLDNVGTVWSLNNGEKIVKVSSNGLPSSLAAGPNDSLYILYNSGTTDTLLQESTSGSSYVQTLSTTITPTADRNYLSNIASSSKGNVFVVDRQAHNILELIPSGSTFNQYVIATNVSCISVAVDDNDNVYCYDGNTSVVQLSPIPRSPLSTDYNQTVHSTEIEYLGTDQHVHQFFNFSGTWGSGDLTTSSGAPSAMPGSALATDFNTLLSRQEIEYVGTDQHVHQLYYTGSAWVHVDLTATTGATLAIPGSALVTDINPFGPSTEIDYLGIDQHVHQIYDNAAGWQTGDLMVSAKAPSATIGSALATDFNSVLNRQEMEYIGTDQHVHQLYYSGSGWAHVDLTSTARAALANPGTALAADFNQNGNSIEINYLGTDQHIHQIYNNSSSGTWQTGDLTTAAGAPSAMPGSALSTDFNSVLNRQELEYIGIDQHVHQLYYNPGLWSHIDLTAATGAPLALPGTSLSTDFDHPDQSLEIEYIGVDQHVHQLFNSSGVWGLSDLTTATYAPLAQ